MVHRRLAFCLSFAAVLVVLLLLFGLWQATLAQVYMYPVSATSRLLLDAAGVDAALDASAIHQGYCTIRMPGIAFEVVHECTGIFTLLILIAAVLAYPARATAKASGAAAMTAAFYAYSSLRLTALGLVAHLAPDAVDVLHLWVMVLANFGFAMYLWHRWTEGVGPP